MNPRHKLAVGPCLHCHNAPGRHHRGLCRRCYLTPGVRALYPRRSGAADHEPSAAEIELLVAEQLRPENLPDWWQNSMQEQLRSARPGIRVIHDTRREGGVHER